MRCFERPRKPRNFPRETLWATGNPARKRALHDNVHLYVCVWIIIVLRVRARRVVVLSIRVGFG